MRTLLSAMVVLLGATISADARSTLSPDFTLPSEAVPPRTEPARAIAIPSAETYLHRGIRKGDDSSLLLSNDRTPGQGTPAAIPSLNLGIFHAELGGNVNGHAQLAHYSLEGVRVLGGGISGSVDGRGARFNIAWPTGN